MLEGLSTLLIRHDLVAVFVVVLLATLGVPIPALPVLLLAGAQAASGGPFGIEALGIATLASMLSATTWFVAGRRLGRRVLALLCRISISPDTCVRRNEVSFATRGAFTLVIAKFVPGLSILAPPLAGALGMKDHPRGTLGWNWNCRGGGLSCPDHAAARNVGRARRRGRSCRRWPAGSLCGLAPVDAMEDRVGPDTFRADRSQQSRSTDPAGTQAGDHRRSIAGVENGDDMAGPGRPEHRPRRSRSRFTG